MIALFTGVYYLVSGRLNWGPLDAHAIFHYLNAVALKVWLEEAPLIFGVANAVHSIISGILLRVPRKE